MQLATADFLQEDILLIDFGQSFTSFHPPTGYEPAPATVPHHCPSPEAHFIGSPSDIWALACRIFQIRAGFPLFEAFLGGDDEVLKEIMATRGKLLEPWWGAFENRHLWSDEDGKPKAPELRRVLLPVEKTTVKEKWASIGGQDASPAT